MNAGATLLFTTAVYQEDIQSNEHNIFIMNNCCTERQDQRNLSLTKQCDCCFDSNSRQLQYQYVNSNDASNNWTGIAFDIPFLDIDSVSTHSSECNDDITEGIIKHSSMTTFGREDSFVEEKQMIYTLLDGSLTSKSADESSPYMDDDDSIDNTSCSSFDIDEYSSSAGTTENEIDNEFDIADDDVDWQNGPYYWNGNSSEVLVPCSNPCCDRTPTSHRSSLRSSWVPSRKQVRFNTITIRKFDPEDIDRFPKTKSQVCTNKQRLAATDNAGDRMDLTIDLRDYEWMQRNLRRIMNTHTHKSKDKLRKER